MMLRYMLAVAVLALAGCSTAVETSQANAVVGPVVEGKLSGSTELRYISFSNTTGTPVIATEAYVDQKSGRASWTVYKTYGGELYNDAKLPDVILVDGSKDFDVTATLDLTGSDYKRFYFVNLSTSYDIHVFMGGSNAYKVGGPMTTSLIIANDTDFQVISNAPAYIPSVVRN